MKALIAMLLIGVMFITACASQEAATTGQAASPQEDRSNQLYVVVAALTGHPYFLEHNRGVEYAGIALGVNTEFLGPVDIDLPAMITALEQAIVRQPAGIGVIGMGEELAPSINAALAAGIPVVTIDGDVATSDRLGFIGTGNYSVGLVGGEKMSSLLGGSGSVMVLSNIGQPNLDERMQGYLDYFERYTNIEVVQISNTDSDDATVASAVAATLLTNPDLDGIVVTDATGPGIVAALREAGLSPGDVRVVGMDRTEDNIELIQEGWVDAVVAQRTALMSFLAIQMLYNIHNDDINVTPDDQAAGILALPDVVDTGTILITPDNAHLF